MFLVLCKRIYFILALCFCLLPATAHVADEISVKNEIILEDGRIRLRLTLASGVLFSTNFLKTLDPDGDRVFQDADCHNFAQWLGSSLSIRVNDKPVLGDFVSLETSQWPLFAAGVSTVVAEWLFPVAVNQELNSQIHYLISFYPQVATHTLSIKNNYPHLIAITEEKRNEFLQDEVKLSITRDAELVAKINQPHLNPLQSPHKNQDLEEKNDKWNMEKILSLFQQDGNWKKNIVWILLLSWMVGFFHAFTPGHGKALVGAFLIANQGTLYHALALGLVITLSHTLSIYLLGLGASAAAGAFLPSQFIVPLTVVSGILITGLGLFSFIRRLRGTEIDHAHLIPNLQVLCPTTVNILVDGTAAQVNETLLIATQEEESLQLLKAVGAEDFNLCSPGCQTHGFLPLAIQERQKAEFFRLAIKTGAVDGMVTATDATIRCLGPCVTCTEVAVADKVQKSPQDFLQQAVARFSCRGKINIPAGKLSWKKVISLGLAGGLVPCPDALALLLVATAAGQVGLGLLAIFLFSLGLALALIGVGFTVVLTKQVVARKKGLSFLAQLAPYGSSLFISFLGVLMIAGAL